MIVSHSRRFIFLKPKKTGGTSIELALSTLCGPNDIITPTDEEQFRKGVRPQNYVVPFRDWLWHLGLRRDGAAEPKLVFAPHSRGREIQKHLGREVWNSYLKVTILRNPWDREVSRYFWERGRPHIPDSFEAFVEQVTARRPIGNDALRCGLHKDDRTFFIRYESLSDDFAKLARLLGENKVPELAKAKGQTRPAEVRNYRDMYSTRLRDKVASIYRREIKVFGYKF